MPQAVLKLLLLFALAVAVPAQGISAVTAGFCMAMGHHQGHGTQIRHAHAAADHDHAAMMASQPDAAVDSSESRKPGGDSHCPPCVSCCAVTAIVPEAPVALPDAPPGAAIAAVDYAALGVLPERLDRPPLAL